MKETTVANIKKVGNFVNRFVESDYFLVLNALLVFVGWAFNIWVPMLCIMVAISVLPLFFFRETKHLLSAIMMFTIIIRAYRHNLNAYAPLLVLVIVLFVGLAFNLIRFRRDFRPLSPTRIKGFHVALFALIIPFALGGAGSPTDSALAIVGALAFAVVYALGYSFFVVTNQDRADKHQLMDYILKTLFVMGVIIVGEMILFFVDLGSMQAVRDAILLKNINLGWAGANNVAPVLAMSIPATLFLCINKNKATPLLVLISLVELVVVFITGSRGSILMVAIFIVPVILYVMAKTQNRVLFATSLSIFIGVGILLLAYFGKDVSVYITKVLDKGLDDSSRIETLYKPAIEIFKQYPIFGDGWDRGIGWVHNNHYTPIYYHSTVFQIMATMGVVGIITFIPFYFWRYRTFLAMRKHPEAIALLVSTIILDGYGMVDTTFFSPTFFLMLLAMTFVVDVNVPDDKCRAFGGRNPFKDALDFAKWLIAKMSKKPIAQVANGNEQCDLVAPIATDSDEALSEDSNCAVNATVNQTSIDDEIE